MYIKFVICDAYFVICANLKILFKLFLEGDQGHRPIPVDVLEVSEQHAVVGHKNWPRFSEEDVLQAVNDLDSKFADDFDRVRQFSISKIYYFHSNYPMKHSNKSLFSSTF